MADVDISDLEAATRIFMVTIFVLLFFFFLFCFIVKPTMFGRFTVQMIEIANFDFLTCELQTSVTLIDLYSSCCCHFLFVYVYAAVIADVRTHTYTHTHIHFNETKKKKTWDNRSRRI